MKSYDVVGYIHDCEVYCDICRASIKDANPIFVDSEWDTYPTCCNCGYIMTEVNVIYNDEWDNLLR